jgi:hypothetical protein
LLKPDNFKLIPQNLSEKILFWQQGLPARMAFANEIEVPLQECKVTQINGRGPVLKIEFPLRQKIATIFVVKKSSNFETVQALPLTHNQRNLSTELMINLKAYRQHCITVYTILLLILWNLLVQPSSWKLKGFFVISFLFPILFYWVQRKRLLSLQNLRALQVESVLLLFVSLCALSGSV